MSDQAYRIVTADGREVRQVWPYGKVKGHYGTPVAARKALPHCPKDSRIQVIHGEWTDLE